MEIPPELCLELLMAADYLDSELCLLSHLIFDADLFSSMIFHDVHYNSLWMDMVWQIMDMHGIRRCRHVSILF